MPFRPPFPSAANTFSSINPTNNLRNLNVLPQVSSDAFRENVRANFPNSQFAPPANLNRFSVPPPNSINAESSVYNNVPLNRPSDNMPPLSHPNFMNTRPHNLNSFPSRLPNVNASFRPFQDQSCIKNTVPPIASNTSATNFNFEHRNISIQQFPPPRHNVTCNSLQPNNNYPRFQNNSSNIYPTFQNNSSNNYPAFQTNPSNNNSINAPVILSNSPQFPVNANRSTTDILNLPTSYSVGNTNNLLPQHTIQSTPLTSPAMLNSYEVSSNLQNNFMQIPLQLPQNNAFGSQNLRLSSNPVIQSKETKIAEFLSKFSVKQKENKEQVTVPEFRYVIKAVMRMMKLLNERKNKLSTLLDASESEWNSEVENIMKEKEELSTLYSFLSAPDCLSNIVEKLKLIKKRRERKKKTKQNKFSEKMRRDQKRKERDQEIDKWLDDIKEKNEKIKRESELKKEADYILLEVRRKIYEAKKTIEKIKVFEKLRSARQANASKKGLHVLSIHNVKFEKKMHALKETMVKQLEDYEAEERALKVMLETEQEGQREEEIQWKIKKMKTLQQKKQNHIMECLFGKSDDPLPTDPMYLFHKYHTSADSSIENFVQIRSQWDTFISEDGEVIPQHWIAPSAPSIDSWKQCLLNPEN